MSSRDGSGSSIIILGGICAAMCYSMSVRLSCRPQHSYESGSSRLFASRSKLLLKLLDLGGFFGVDIGGSLSKILFFLPDKDLATDMLRRIARSGQRNSTEECVAKLGSVHQLAGFILSKTHYGLTGVRDAELSFDMPDLGGSFHFIRFETRRMEGALNLARKHGLTAGMHTICATGGGAQKVGSHSWHALVACSPSRSLLAPG